MITPDTREYRSFPVEVRQEDNEHAAGWIHGRAVVFNSPAVMYTDPETGIEYTEEIDAHAFDECDMSDAYERQSRRPGYCPHPEQNPDS